MLVELVGSEVSKRLVEAPRLVTVVPGEQGVLEAAEVGGQVVDVVELIVVGPGGKSVRCARYPAGSTAG